MKPIFISAGHGGTDPGAAAYGTTEADVVLAFRDMVADCLKARGVAFTRDGSAGQNLPLRDAVKMVPLGGIAVEFHLNAAASASATGVETLSAAKDFPFGSGLCKVIAGRLGIRDRGAKGESSGQHSRLAFVQAGGVIVELFFLTNPSDLAAYDRNRSQLASDVADNLIKAAS